jgi:hypothetical protein
MPVRLEVHSERPHLIVLARRLPSWRIILAHADRAAKRLFTVWRTWFQDARAAVPTPELEDALEEQGLLGGERVTMDTWDRTVEAPARVVVPPLLAETVTRTAEALVPHLENAVSVTFGTVPSVQPVPASEPWIQQYAGEQITLISQNTRLAVRTILREGFSEGTSVQRLAGELKQHLGLTRPQLRSLRNLEARLQARGLSAREVERQLAIARRVAIRQRALNVARTEALAAASAGQQLLWERAEAQGLFAPDTARRSWLTARDEKVCPICGPMDGQQRGLHEPFQSGEGALWRIVGDKGGRWTATAQQCYRAPQCQPARHRDSPFRAAVASCTSRLPAPNWCISRSSVTTIVQVVWRPDIRAR